MPPSEPGPSAFVWLFGAMSFAVLVFAASVAFGYGREARLAVRLFQDARRSRRALVIGAAAFGSGLWSAMLLAVASEPLGYLAGYHPLILLGAWIGAVALGGAVLAPMARNPSRRAVTACAAVFGLGVPWLQMAVAGAVEPDPGFDWGIPEALLAACVAALGALCAFHIVFRAEGRHGRYRHLLRWVAAILVAVAVAVGQGLTLGAAAPPAMGPALAPSGATQIVVATLAALVVPAALLIGLIRLWIVREARHHAPASAGAPDATRRPASPSNA